MEEEGLWGQGSLLQVSKLFNKVEHRHRFLIGEMETFLLDMVVVEIGDKV